MSNIVKLNDYRKTASDKNILSDIDPAKLAKLYEDIMQGDSVHVTIEDATVDFARAIIAQLFEIGIDPEDAAISDDMVFITMLFTAALEEFYTGRHDSSGGEENTMYRYLKEMKDGNIS